MGLRVFRFIRFVPVMVTSTIALITRHDEGHDRAHRAPRDEHGAGGDR